MPGTWAGEAYGIIDGVDTERRNWCWEKGSVILLIEYDPEICHVSTI